MAALNDISNAERHKQWYDPDITEVNQPMRSLLENYSGISPDKVVNHINDIRARGFRTNPYPCIGNYRFLNLTLLTHPLYRHLVERLKTDPTTVYLDVGCCFGQDLRQLAHDGVPSRQLVGVDVEAALMELGHDLFLDRDTSESRFLVVDVLRRAGSEQQQEETWMRLVDSGADVVHCSAFFHLFPLTDQLVAARNVARLVRVGGVIVGRQSGSVTPGEVPAVKAGTTSFRHDVETWRDLWGRVGGETGTVWEVSGTLDMVGMVETKKSDVEDENSRRLLFTVKRVA